MCEVYGFCGSKQTLLNKYTDEFWKHSKIHKDGFGYYLADHDELYVNADSANSYLIKLAKKKFISDLALCHIRFKTHGAAKIENCHPFVKYDVQGIKWTLIHNGFIDNNNTLEALATIQSGDTDSERILLFIVEAINSLYEHNWITDVNELQYYMYIQIEAAIQSLGTLGKTNLIFTDNYTDNMYVYMNAPNTLFYLNTSDGVHVATTPLSNEDWKPVTPCKLHIFNNGVKLDY